MDKKAEKKGTNQKNNSKQGNESQIVKRRMPDGTIKTFKKKSASNEAGNASFGKENKASKKAKKSNGIVSIVVPILLGLIAIGLITLGVMSSMNIGPFAKGEAGSNEPETTTEPAPIHEFKGVEVAKYNAKITEYFIYGTSLCINGSIKVADLGDIKVDEKRGMKLIVRNAYTNPDGSIDETNLLEHELDVTYGKKTIKFKGYDAINNGINLEKVTDGEYIALLKFVDTTGKDQYANLTKHKQSDNIEYYTLTNNGKNHLVDIHFDTHDNVNYVAVNVSTKPLPDDVYDIALDAGHGGNDPGACNGDYNEKTMMLDYALKTKAQLEQLGYKVYLTRDGSEGDDEWLAFNMYKTDGRVNKACRSRAKYCLSMHLNSNAANLTQGGIQIYYSCRANQSFAKNMVDSIVKYSGTYYSPMSAFKVNEGVYSRSFSDADVAENAQEAINSGYDPYPATNDTDYYFMIRELGGVATNAYNDGRNTKYPGENEFRNSIYGVESVIMELGFISIDSDLEHLIKNEDGYVEGISVGFDNFVKTISATDTKNDAQKTEVTETK